MPVSVADRQSEHYEPGVSCPHCHDGLDEARKTRLREREKQIRLARARGESHLGDDAADTEKMRRAAKRQAKDRQRLRNVQQGKLAEN
jgi:UPF0176 protein